MTSTTLLLAQSDIHQVLRAAGRDQVMDRMIERLHTAFVAADVGRAVTPARQGFLTGTDRTGVLEWMPHHDPGQAITIKTVSYAPMNPVKFGLPTILGTIARFDDETGHMVGLCDGVLPTAVRTGAASAVATRLFAHPESKVVGLIGAGAQAVTQLHALSRVLDIETVLVYDTTPKHSASFSQRVGFLGLDIRVVPLEELEARADVICTATSVDVGQGPVLQGHDLREHLHINAIGADLPGKFEVPSHVLKNAFVCPDHFEQALREGECQQVESDDLGPSLPSVCANPRLAKGAQDGLSVFDSTGFALEDHVAFDVFHEFARHYGIGRRVNLESVSSDSHNPYGDAFEELPAGGAVQQLAAQH
ncbi:ornithine cyclodeaminase family protein [Streptomyces platensis]|uniref:ornithine cyclodeaminase family protein n=1 Tax=Streptomyces platensis TaxID=58346 RepID=UPI002E26D4F4|nr:ornithine cyclodeaminase family protein [Streptomyces platensis]WUB85087.1 ornithine cyclodeaminase family protein [Streptomyces platensis]